MASRAVMAEDGKQSWFKAPKWIYWFTFERRLWIAGIGLSAAISGGYANGTTTQHSLDAVANKEGLAVKHLQAAQHELKIVKGATTSSKAEPALVSPTAPEHPPAQ